MGTYQLQTNFSVETLQTSIRATGSTSKGHGEGGNFTINRPSLDQVITLLQIPPPTPLAPSPWMLIWWPRLEFVQFSRICWFVHDMFSFIFFNLTNGDDFATISIKAMINRDLSSEAVAKTVSVNAFYPPRLRFLQQQQCQEREGKGRG